MSDNRQADTGPKRAIDALLPVAPLIPVVAALGAVVSLLIWHPASTSGNTEPRDLVALVAGLVLAIVFCTVVARWGRSNGNRAARRRDARSRAELELRLAMLKAKLDANPGADGLRARSEVKNAYNAIARALGLPAYAPPDTTPESAPAGGDLAPDYPALFDWLHEAEAAAFEIEQPTHVLRDAQYDHLRLTGSSINNAAELQSTIETAIAAFVAAHRLSANALVYVTGPTTAVKQTAATTGRTAATTNSASPGTQISNSSSVGTDKTAGAAAAGAALTPGTTNQPGKAAGSAGPQKRLPVTIGTTLASLLLRGIFSFVSFASHTVDRACIRWTGNRITKKGMPAPATTGEPRDVADARTSLRNVRVAIEQYRQARYAGLRQLGRKLQLIGFFSALTTLLLLTLAIAADAPWPSIGGAAAIYGVGAGVGLFSRMYADSTADTAIEDYGLTTARVVTTPVVSGIAAVIGVLLTGYVTIGFNPTSYQIAATTATSSTASTAVGTRGTPPTTAALQSAAGVASTGTSSTGSPSTSGAQGSNLTLRPLADVFDLSLFPFDLVIAAIFGFAPRLVLDNLQQQADKYKSELQSSQASDGSAKTSTKAAT